MIALVLLAACGARSHDVGRAADSDADSDPVTDSPSTDADVDADTDTDVDTDADTDTATDSDTPTSDVRPCDPMEDACVGPDEKCGLVYPEPGRDLESACMPNGFVGDGGRCSLTPFAGHDGYVDNCVGGLGCLTLGHDEVSTCHPLCPCADFACKSDGCGPTEFCTVLEPGFPTGICYPTTPCDPVDQTGCPDGENCYLIGPIDRTLSECAAYVPLDGSAGTSGEPCVYINNCDRGFTCRMRDFEPTCARFCDPLGGVCEPGEGACTAIEGFESAGVCE